MFCFNFVKFGLMVLLGVLFIKISSKSCCGGDMGCKIGIAVANTTPIINPSIKMVVLKW